MTDLAAAYGRLSANARGALWMLASALAFTLMTTLIKYLGAEYSPALQTFYRQLAGLLALTPIIARNPARAFAAKRHGLLLFRAAAGTIGMILAFYAYQQLPLAEANALSFTRSLWLVPLAVLVLREQVGPWRVGATLVGFAGAVIMLRPTGDLPALPALAALASALLFAMTVTGMKALTRDHSITTLIVWSAVLGLAFAAPLALIEWRWPTPLDLLLLAAMGVLGLANQALYIKAMSLGEATAMAPIEYTRLAIALVVGFVLFHEIPDSWAMAGALVVIAAALFITLREARMKQPPAISPE